MTCCTIAMKRSLYITEGTQAKFTYEQYPKAKASF